ncbi:MAG: phosphate ABC transporter permease PstA [Actinobacteria bacterium]|nr:phosphate ABC transporter permease PstA [Actinomycetota bacterium]
MTDTALLPKPSTQPGFGPVLEPSQRTDVRAKTVSAGRRRTDKVATIALWCAVLAAVVPLGAVITVLVAKGFGVVNWHFLTSDIPSVTGQTTAACRDITPAFRAKYGINCSPPAPGMGPAIVGTLISTGLAAALAIPIGILGAVYCNEIGVRTRLASAIRFFADVMIGVPSIVMGMFIYTAWVVRFGTNGRSAFAAALALACLMLPIVLRSAEEMLRLVPDELRHANLALGGRPSQGVIRVVLPAALPGLISGSLLAVARAAGETAPVLFTIGVTLSLNTSPFGENTTLAQQIFSGAKSGLPLANQLAWGAAFTLVAIVFGLSALARFVASRSSKVQKG